MSPGVGLLDTSIFIARENGRALGELPDRVAVSVVTIGELQLGVLIAATAVEHGLPVVTQDSDYGKIADVHPDLRVAEV